MENETVASPNEAEVVVPDTTTEETTETIEEVKAKLTKAEELAKNYKIRAEKAEGKVKTEPKVETKPEPTVSKELPQKDLIALVRANVPDEDIETVKKFALLEGISVTDALKNDDLKAVLERRANVRKSADTANTNPVRRTSTKIDDATLLEKARKGEVPEKGSAEAEQLFWAKRGGKK